MAKPILSKKPQTTSSDGEIEKLFERAVAASLQHQSDIAVTILNEVLQRQPYHARARHLLGAEYAQAGRIEDALAEMSAALEIDPNMPLARFQFGLLLLTCARQSEAFATWAPLDTLGSEHVLNRFRAGMILMAQGNFDSARQLLTAAMAENIELPALNHELAAAIEAINSARARHAQGDEEESTEDQNTRHILISSYVQSSTVH